MRETQRREEEMKRNAAAVEASRLAQEAYAAVAIVDTCVSSLELARGYPLIYHMFRKFIPLPNFQEGSKDYANTCFMVAVLNLSA